MMQLRVSESLSNVCCGDGARDLELLARMTCVSACLCVQRVTSGGTPGSLPISWQLLQALTWRCSELSSADARSSSSFCAWRTAPGSSLATSFGISRSVLAIPCSVARRCTMVKTSAELELPCDPACGSMVSLNAVLVARSLLLLPASRCISTLVGADELDGSAARPLSKKLPAAESTL